MNTCRLVIDFPYSSHEINIAMVRRKVTKIMAERKEAKGVEKRKEMGVEKSDGKHFRQGIHSLAEVHKYQKSFDLLIRRLL